MLVFVSHLHYIIENNNNIIQVTSCIEGLDWESKTLHALVIPFHRQYN